MRRLSTENVGRYVSKEIELVGAHLSSALGPWAIIFFILAAPRHMYVHIVTQRAAEAA